MYAVISGHNRSAFVDHPTVAVVESLDAAADAVAAIAKSYGLIIDNSGVVFDPDDPDLETVESELGDNGRPIRFTHCDGDGPVVRTVEVE